MAKRQPAASTNRPVQAAGKKTVGKAKPISVTDLRTVFDHLKALLISYAPEMIVTKDDPTWYYLDTKMSCSNKNPLMFAAVRLGKNYTSYYLMPLYMNPGLEARISPALAKRRQGKSCFNFITVDNGLFAELAALTRAGYECFTKLGGA